jgi:hypothetical protein
LRFFISLENWLHLRNSISWSLLLEFKCFIVYLDNKLQWIIHWMLGTVFYILFCNFDTSHPAKEMVSFHWSYGIYCKGNFSLFLFYNFCLFGMLSFLRYSLGPGLDKPIHLLVYIHWLFCTVVGHTCNHLSSTELLAPSF